jgi:hypothetical protein
MNAVRHGLFADCVVLQNESREGFDEMSEDFIARFQPADGVELALVEEMLSAFWRQRRAWAIETRILDTAMSNECAADGLTRLANAFVAASAQPSLQLIQRYETRLHRIFQRALSNLVLMRSLDKQPEPPPVEPSVSESKSEEEGETPVPVEALAEQESAAATGASDDDQSSGPLPDAPLAPGAADLDAVAALPAPACPPPFDPVERDVDAPLAPLLAPWPEVRPQQPPPGAVGTSERTADLKGTGTGNRHTGATPKTQYIEYFL